MIKKLFISSIALHMIWFLSCEKDPVHFEAGPLSIVEISPIALNIAIDSTFKFTAIGKDSNKNIIEGHTFTWRSSCPAIGIIDQNGIFTALSSGMTSVTAASDSIESGESSVIVYDMVDTVEIMEKSINVYIDSTIQLVAEGRDINGSTIDGLSFNWESEHENVASVDDEGYVKGVSVGTTDVIASLRLNKSAPCVVTVDEKTTGFVRDIDGNTYRTIKIGNQWWMRDNLKVTHYRNSDPIDKITGNSNWGSATTSAYCVYDNNDSNEAVYGCLYNRLALVDGRKIAPEGWHVPRNGEWQILIDYLGGGEVAGGKMKEIGFSHWENPNTGATDESGFSALPGGYRDGYGQFKYLGYTANYWTPTTGSSGQSQYLHLSYYSAAIYIYSGQRNQGFSVRCVKD